MKRKVKAGQTGKAKPELTASGGETKQQLPTVVAPMAEPGATKPPGILKQERIGKLTVRPFPEDLLEEAEQEPDHRELAEYLEVVVKLREKGFSFREIADWLEERNVEADHNAVYRVYSKHMTRKEGLLEAGLDEEEKVRALKSVGQE